MTEASGEYALKHVMKMEEINTFGDKSYKRNIILDHKTNVRFKTHCLTILKAQFNF